MPTRTHSNQWCVDNTQYLRVLKPVIATIRNVLSPDEGEVNTESSGKNRSLHFVELGRSLLKKTITTSFLHPKQHRSGGKMDFVLHACSSLRAMHNLTKQRIKKKIVASEKNSIIYRPSRTGRREFGYANSSRPPAANLLVRTDPTYRQNGGMRKMQLLEHFHQITFNLETLGDIFTAVPLHWSCSMRQHEFCAVYWSISKNKQSVAMKSACLNGHPSTAMKMDSSHIKLGCCTTREVIQMAAARAGRRLPTDAPSAASTNTAQTGNRTHRSISIYGVLQFYFNYSELGAWLQTSRWKAARRFRISSVCPESLLCVRVPVCERVEGTLQPESICDTKFFGESSSKLGIIRNPSNQHTLWNSQSSPVLCTQTFVPTGNQSITLKVEWLPVGIRSWTPISLMYSVAPTSLPSKGFHFQADYLFHTDSYCGNHLLISVK
ncbi:unnamed protein product [Nesidiocoris tenuis]|uniref:Uncharacterized protein n=1 Tax=Nesidiocoris tenuis TaxID=355587 RepID=A0A6H5FVT7_9HEMI|nr:unnamed protein product [Nesidiocoris tenuis]